MLSGIYHIATRSILYHKRKIAQQTAVIALLAAIITGSLLTGFSVRETLRRTASDKLGNARFLITSGLRYFEPSLSERLQAKTGISNTVFIETDGFIQNFTGGQKSLNVKIYGVDEGFFGFQGIADFFLKPGEAALNSTLAASLKIYPGDEIILTMNSPQDVPSSSPFSTLSPAGNSHVFKIAAILNSDRAGNFSTAISQINPDNIFLRIDEEIFNKKANRIIAASGAGVSERNLMTSLQEILLPSDIGLFARKVRTTGECELISSRVFIDQAIIDAVTDLLPDAQPVISYLVNRISHNGLSTPYSFSAGVSVPYVPGGDSITVNDWLANDLKIKAGDTVSMTWYSPANTGRLEEKNGNFVIGNITGMNGALADSMLMPEFPGIAKSVSCSRWNAGVEIRTDLIRKKDEDYWKRYRGLPKVFMSYNEGKALWGNNFGPATAIRLPYSYNTIDIIKILSGHLPPASAGFTVRNVYKDMVEAAKKSVDFGLLFLALGLFIIISCIIILMLAVASHLETRYKEILTYRSLGFRKAWIRKYLILESGLVSFTGSVTGAAAGLIINVLFIKALNSVWTGAVNTSTLQSYNGLLPFLAGSVITFLLSVLFIWLNIERYIRKEIKVNIGTGGIKSKFISKTTLGVIVLISLMVILLNFSSVTRPVVLSFVSGVLLFVSLIAIWGFIVTRGINADGLKFTRRRIISGTYYAWHPGRAVLPVLIIAAGLFAVVITGINRLKITSQSLSSSGGTGGVRYWIESSVPIKEDLNTPSGRKKYGLEELSGTDIHFIQCKKSAGNDASCLNLNFIASPTLLGVDPSDFIQNRAFSFSTLASFVRARDPWSIITQKPAAGNTVYGFADQTVLEWGLKRRTGDTLKFRSESGYVLNVVIAGGLRSSVFQGYLIIGLDNFNRSYPSVPGYSIMMVRGSSAKYDSLPGLLSERFANFGINIQDASDRLASFFTVTNTYLSVFSILGFLGVLLGVTGVGFILNRIYTSRIKEFAFMVSAGFRLSQLKWIIVQEQLLILAAGIVTGVISGIVSSSSSLNGFKEISWFSLFLFLLAIFLSGIISIMVSVRSIRQEDLITVLRKE